MVLGAFICCGGDCTADAEIGGWTIVWEGEQGDEIVIVREVTGEGPCRKKANMETPKVSNHRHHHGGARNIEYGN